MLILVESELDDVSQQLSWLRNWCWPVFTEQLQEEEQQEEEEEQQEEEEEQQEEEEAQTQIGPKFNVPQALW